MTPIPWPRNCYQRIQVPAAAALAEWAYTSDINRYDDEPAIIGTGNDSPRRWFRRDQQQRHEAEPQWAVRLQFANPISLQIPRGANEPFGWPRYDSQSRSGHADAKSPNENAL